MQYAVLALGDSEYAQFCGFGHRLDDWLHAQGATPLFDLVEVDNGDPAALRHWQQLLGQLGGGASELPDWSPAEYQPWTLLQREHLNPGSPGGPVYWLRLQPPAGAAVQWQAGDIAGTADEGVGHLDRHRHANQPAGRQEQRAQAGYAAHPHRGDAIHRAGILQVGIVRLVGLQRHQAALAQVQALAARPPHLQFGSHATQVEIVGVIHLHGQARIGGGPAAPVETATAQREAGGMVGAGFCSWPPTVAL
ncbi:hypothetical protein G6F40_013790 [Rhizopus arrhizus]|nr:hypothetical protein G6F40_013790 [Rhizopus arrhizus]